MKIEEAGSNMMDRGNLAEAEKLFKQALEIKPDFGNAMVGLGQVYSKMGKEDQAIEMFSKGLHNEPLLPDLAYGNLGAIYENRGESENALKYYKKAAETAPEPTGALVNIGRLYIEMNRPDSAEIVLRRALYNLSDMKIANRASMIFAKRFRRNNPEEVEFIEEKLKKGITEEDVSIYDKEMFLQSRMYSPRAVAIYHLLGVALAMTGKFDEGIEHIRKGLEIQPDNPDIKHDLQTAIAEKERAGI
ncbi:tetratricopeptide repeat protein [bacterium]|nr:tetratricopeptide repeat protein [bacterium]